MEQWEIDERARLEKELPDGSYKIGGDGMTMYTGKGGYINYLISLHKEMKNIQMKLKKHE